MTSCARRRASTVVATLLVASWATRVSLAAEGSAGASRVVLVREPGADAIIDRAEVRLAAELRAAGFQVEERIVEAEEARRLVEEPVDEGPFATVLLRRAGNRAATDVWVADHLTHKTVLRQISSRGGDGSDRALALSVVELMRASLVEPLVLPPQTQDTDAPPVPPPPRTAPPPPDVDRWTREAIRDPFPSTPPVVGLRLGMAGVYAGPDIGLSLAPEMHLLWHASPTLGIGVFGATTVAGGAIAERQQGRATVSEQLVLVEVSWEPPLPGPFHLDVSLGAGAYHLFASGEAAHGFVSNQDDAWAGLGSAGLAVRWQITTVASLLVDAKELLALPRPVVLFANEHVASAMHPGTLAGVSVAVDL